ncbi:MAG: DNA polymerase III subunit delta [Clostridiales bacterium]|jgi:DNA polymerase III delta subunit|nr:DNA polymerase III subunit delta [Clostridiales bacterium]
MLSANQFFTEIKNDTVHGFYLFHGSEEYIKLGALNRLKESVDDCARFLNVQEFEKPLAATIRAACDTLPFLSARRVVVCHDMADAEIKLLTPYIASMPPTTVLILYVRGECGAQTKKLLGGHGREVNFQPLDEHGALLFVLNRANKRGVKIERGVAALLVDMVGAGVHTLENELNKLMDYACGAPINDELIRALITPNPEYQRYNMLDALLKNDVKTAMEAMFIMLKDGSESVFGLAHFFSGQCKNMLCARLLLDTGARGEAVGSRLGLYPKPARAALSGAKRLSAAQLREALLAFAGIDYLQLSGRVAGDAALHAAVARFASQLHAHK